MNKWLYDAHPREGFTKFKARSSNMSEYRIGKDRSYIYDDEQEAREVYIRAIESEIIELRKIQEAASKGDPRISIDPII